MLIACTLGRNLHLGAYKDIQIQKNISFQNADINALLSKQIFIAKEVRFMRIRKVKIVDVKLHDLTL